MRWIVAAALALFISTEAAAQSEPNWMDRGESSNTKEQQPGPTVQSEPKPATRTAAPKTGFGEVVDFFLGDPDEPKRDWGFVPLVVADSNAGFGGGIQINDNDILHSKLRGEVYALYTSNGFFESQLRLMGPPIFALDWRTFFRYRSRPQLFFFGIGNETKYEDRLSLWLEDTMAEGRLGLVVTPNVFLFGLGQLAEVHARDGRAPEPQARVSRRYDGDTLTGFEDKDDFTNALGAAAVVDLRDDFLYPLHGARIELRGLYHGPEIGDSPFRFGEYVLDAAYYVTLVDKWKTVLALGLRQDSVDGGMTRVPFYSLPYLGGTRSLRGFLEGRFRDRNATLVQAEVRFPIWHVLSAAVFTDAGRVYSDFDRPPAPFEHYHYDAGAGLRLVIQPDIFTRLDFAMSKEDFTFALEFGNAF